ncbi:Carbon monoxide dehydrogenase subunit G (CoxG) [Pigmentiphaga humi]|uniref:Carbon monoxide dehydrogenase subunit G (CoxG) n=1 Tax=Pigmentiphaga humi TaxID=2478468 RepID=A0A3P4B287_9BURK|nr:carbon monoxide dehydrogenase subunit G [Pigmentiphaga humi]VCU70011.1 Carbon monoxide dehydrogenase subunit G (CoxG) [Pigmentiphaga humi]
MELSGSRLIPASQEHTWEKLVAPDTLKVCINGCERVERLSDHEYLVKLRAQVGPLSARFEGRLEMADIDAPHSYRLRFEGSGGAAGSARGSATIRLTPEGDATRVSYTAHADLEGRLSQLRPEQAEKIARKMMDNFFALFSVCACRALERPAPRPPRSARPLPARAPALALHGVWVHRLSWLAPPIVIAALIAYHTFMH